MTDFFEVIEMEDIDDHMHPMSLFKALCNHPLVVDRLSTEEVYASLALVSKDLFMNETEIAIWWAILESFGIDLELSHLLVGLYCAGYAAKQACSGSSIVDKKLVENNFVPNFTKIYPVWAFHKDLTSIPTERVQYFYHTVPQFLNKFVDYDSVVEGLTPNDEDDILQVVPICCDSFNDVVDNIFDKSDQVQEDNASATTEESLGERSPVSSGESNRIFSPIHDPEVHLEFFAGSIFDSHSSPARDQVEGCLTIS